MWQKCTDANIQAVVAVAGGYRQPTIVLYRKNILTELTTYLEGGGRKVNDWLNILRISEVIFNEAECFDNINTPDYFLCTHRYQTKFISNALQPSLNLREY